MTIFGEVPDLDELGDQTPDGTETELGDEPQGDGSPAPDQGSLPETEEEFFDLNDIPEEHRKVLAPSFKAMQKAFTQKTQGVAARAKDLSRLEYQAGLLQELVADPEVANFLRSKAARERGGAALPAEGATDRDAAEDYALDPEAQRMIRQEIAKRVRGSVGPLQDKLFSLEEQRGIDRERETFVAAHPDWMELQDGMKEAWRAAGQQGQDLSMEAAYRWAFFEREKGRRAGEARRKDAGKAVAEKAGSGRPSQPVRRPVGSFAQAALQAFADLDLDPKAMGYRGR